MISRCPRAASLPQKAAHSHYTLAAIEKNHIGGGFGSLWSCLDQYWAILSNTEQYHHLGTLGETLENLPWKIMEDMAAPVKMLKMSAWKALLLRSNSSKPQPCFDCKASCRCPIFRFSWKRVDTIKRHQNRVAHVQFILDQTRNL